MTDPALALPRLTEQAERLIDLGVTAIAGLTGDDLHAAVQAAEAAEATGTAAATAMSPAAGHALLAIDHRLAPASALAPLLVHADKPGFIVADMTDVDDFAPIEGTEPPGRIYVLTGVERGDEHANRTPDEMLPVLTDRGRSPLTLTEGIHLALQQPAALERNHCFMTIASRLRRPNGRLDARTPALWLSNGTGRDGTAHRNAPKVGWCWAGNRHTWLGFASARTRTPLG